MSTSIKDSVNIIVVGYNLPEIERDCIASVIKNTTYPYLLTYYDNFKTGHSLTEVWNFLIGKSPCKFICLLNNDTLPSPGWLDRLMETYQIVPEAKCGFVGPSTNQCHSPQIGVGTFEEAEKVAGAVPLEMSDPISGFCFIFKKALWEKLQGFNQKFDFYGAESDFIARAKTLGYQCYWKQDSFVYHIGSASIKSSGKNEEEERNRAKKLYWNLRGK